jgi:hypothetical protein
VVSPNLFNFDLWVTSGHAEHYKDNMFHFEVEKQLFGLKPMNCPGHCLMFKSSTRSYRDLPLRYADFGVLHRNEYRCAWVWDARCAQPRSHMTSPEGGHAHGTHGRAGCRVPGTRVQCGAPGAALGQLQWG